MKLSEAISEKMLIDIKENWPSGINFKNKSTFIGVSHPSIAGFQDINIPMEAIESDKWGIQFQKMDREFKAMVDGLFGALGGHDLVSKVEHNQRKVEYEALLNHPCKTKCDAWISGYRVAIKDIKNDLIYMHRLCDEISKSKTRSRGFYIEQFKDAFERHLNRGIFK